MVDSLVNTTSDMGSASDTEDTLEELVLATMEREGFLSTLKAQIMKFVQENGNVKPGLHVIPSRADQTILQHIFEYLDWVGMRNTTEMLITESPVPIDATLNTHDDPPRLCKLFMTEEDQSDKLPESEAAVDEGTLSEDDHEQEEGDASFLAQNTPDLEDMKNGTYDDSFDPDSKSAAIDSWDYQIKASLPPADAASIEHRELSEADEVDFLNKSKSASEDPKIATDDYSVDHDEMPKSFEAIDRKVEVFLGPVALATPAVEDTARSEEVDCLNMYKSASESSKIGTYEYSFDFDEKSKALASCDHDVEVEVSFRPDEDAVDSSVHSKTGISEVKSESAQENSNCKTYDESDDLSSKSKALASCDHNEGVVLTPRTPATEIDAEIDHGHLNGKENLSFPNQSQSRSAVEDSNTSDRSFDLYSTALESCDHKLEVSLPKAVAADETSLLPDENQNPSAPEDSKNVTYDVSFDPNSKSKADDSCDHKLEVPMTPDKDAVDGSIHSEADISDLNLNSTSALENSNGSNTHDESLELGSTSETMISCDHKSAVRFT